MLKTCLLVAITSLVACGPPSRGFVVVDKPPTDQTPGPAAQTAPTTAARVGLAYPKARRGSVVDDYHGTRVADPYRWLENPDSPETRTWIEAENKITFAHLAGIAERDKIKERVAKLWNYEKYGERYGGRYGVPAKTAGRTIFSRNDGLQNQSVLYAMRSVKAKPTVLFDPNKLSADGNAALTGYAPSGNGKYLAYGVSESGSDWKVWRVRNIKTGKDTVDVLHHIKFANVSWTKNSSGFYYVRFPKPNDKTKLEDVSDGSKVYFHVLGTPQAEDQLVYERPNQKDWYFSTTVTDDGRYLIISAARGTEDKNRVFYLDLVKGKRGKLVELVGKFENSLRFVDNRGSVFWFRTDRDAPRGKIIAVDLRRPEPANWKDVVPQAPETLGSVNVVGNRFVATYMKDARSLVKVFGMDGKYQRDIDLPGIGSVHGFYGRRNDKETFYSFASFTVPTALYRYDIRSGKSTLFREPKASFDASLYETKQVFYKSKDGTKIPMFLVHKKGLVRDGTNPTLLYGYGGFNIPILPGFKVKPLAWLEMGGVYAVANLRGGSEYGEEWHRAGTKLQKQNVFDDFIAAAEWLIAQKVTSSSKLAIHGRSNGGLLVGACLLQRPDLFGATLPAVGVMDMLRFHKFTVGWGWVDDYGSSDNAEEFKAIFAFSPVHNARVGIAYPPTMITTADHDDRVVPAHSFKFAAALQHAHRGEAPVLIRIETKSGHGAGKPTSKKIDEATDELAFIFNALKMSWPAESTSASTP